MTGNKVEICGVDTSTLPTLTHEHMKELLGRAHGGDEEARRELIYGNLRLVLSVVQRFYKRGENMDDLFQVGCIGLMKGLDNFDLSLNVRLSTYCVPMIIGEIRRYLRDNNAIRVSRSMRDTAYRALKARDALSTGEGREPTTAEIARAMEVPEEDVVLALEAIQDPVSLFDPVYQNGGDAIYVMDQVQDKRVSEGAEPAAGAGAQHHPPALLPGPHADGGRPGDRHLPGPGLAAGEGRAAGHAKVYLNAKRRIGHVKHAQGRPMAARPGTKRIVLPGGRRIAAPTPCTRLYAYAL